MTTNNINTIANTNTDNTNNSTTAYYLSGEGMWDGSFDASSPEEAIKIGLAQAKECLQFDADELGETIEVTVSIWSVESDEDGWDEKIWEEEISSDPEEPECPSEEGEHAWEWGDPKGRSPNGGAGVHSTDTCSRCGATRITGVDYNTGVDSVAYPTEEEHDDW